MRKVSYKKTLLTVSAGVLIIVAVILIIILTCGNKDNAGGDKIDDGDPQVLAVIKLPHTDKPDDSNSVKNPTKDIDPDDPDSTNDLDDPDDPANPDEVDDPKDDPVKINIIPGGIPESGRADDSYFDDVVFVGDSVSLKLQYYTMAKRSEGVDCLGAAQFLTAGSLGYRNSLWAVSDKSVHPTYQGTKMLLEDSILACGAKKIYIMLGMNDIAGGNYDSTIDNITTLVSRILEKSPDVIFYFQSVTPRMEDSQTTNLNNEIIREFNKRLLTYCENNGHYFIDIYSVECDEYGNLPTAYCSDPVNGSSGMGIHFTNVACEAWVDYLYTHTAKSMVN